MSYDPLETYWKDFYFRQIDWWRNVLREHPGNVRAIDEINGYKRLLYKKFLIIVDTPELDPKPEAAPVQLALPF